MDFFDRKEHARKHTRLLEVYFGLAIIGMVAAFYLPVAVILNFIRASDELPSVLWNTRPFLEVAGVTLGFILSASLLKIFHLARGGKPAAEILTHLLLC